MPFDDDDLPTSEPVAGVATGPPAAGEDAPTAEEALEEEAQDFRLFRSLIRKDGNISSQTVRKGQKDYEAHGTRAQESVLEQSRQAMEDALSFTRVHMTKDYVRGWYFPDWWADWEPSHRDSGRSVVGGPGLADNKPGEDSFVRDRVVLLETSKGYTSSMGRAVTGQAKDRPARGLDWLLPEEALFLVERGDLDLWWPTRNLEELFPVLQGGGDQAENRQQGRMAEGAPDPSGDVDEYDQGIPLSLQAAYSLLIGQEGERGKVTLHKYQAFSSLRRTGYQLQRAPLNPTVYPPPTASGPTLWKWLFSLIPPKRTVEAHVAGPLLRPGLYRSYQPIYEQLALIPRHKPVPYSSSQFTTQDPYRIHYRVWKGASGWRKTSPPPPDFYMAVVDAQDTSVPTFEEIDALIDATPFLPPKSEWVGPKTLYPRLKHGYRNVLIAVVDHSVINYLRFGEGAFGEEFLIPRFDQTSAPRGAKGGRGGRGGARGGRGGRGRGGRR